MSGGLICLVQSKCMCVYMPRFLDEHLQVLALNLHLQRLGLWPAPSVGLCSASFDWQRFFLAKQDLVPSPGSFTATLAFFPRLLRLPSLAALAFCSASQRSTMEGIKITKEFLPPVTLTKPGVSMRLFEKRNDHMLVIPHLHEYRYSH